MRISDWSSDVCSSDLEEEITVGIGGGERETVAQRRERNGGIQSDLDALMHGAIGISGGAWCPGEERQALQLVPDFGAVERNVPTDTAAAAARADLIGGCALRLHVGGR